MELDFKFCIEFSIEKSDRVLKGVKSPFSALPVRKIQAGEIFELELYGGSEIEIEIEFL